jgi:hypothetical protein
MEMLLMPKEFRSLTDILRKDKAFTSLRKSLIEVDVVQEFEKIFPDLSKSVQAANVNKNILYLFVENSVLRNELNLNRKLMIEKINKYFNQQIITDVKFTNFRNIHRKQK